MSVPHDRVQAHRTPHGTHFNAVDWIAMVLMIVGGLNWGLVGALQLDVVAVLFGEMSAVSRAVYVLVGLAALYGIYTLVKMSKHRSD